MLNTINQKIISNILVMRNFIDKLGLRVEEEFYLKIANIRTYGQYKKLPKNGYLGMQNYDRKECFLVKFKFLAITYEFTSDCIYITKTDYQNILNAFINSEYIAEKREPAEPFYIQSIDNINTYAEEDDEEDVFNTKVYSKDILTCKFVCAEDENSLTPEDRFRKDLIQNIFKLKINEEFYLKIYKDYTTLQYNKKLKEQYLGLRDYEMNVSFLIKFKFILNHYQLYSDCKYLSDQFYTDILSKMMSGEYIIIKNINYKNRVSIFILDNISIYKLDYDEDRLKLESELNYQIDRELEYYNLLSYEPIQISSLSSVDSE